MTSKKNRAFLCFVKFRASNKAIHWWIQTSYNPQKSNLGQIRWFCACVTLKFDGWPWKNNRTPLLYDFKLCAPFHIHRWILTRVIVRKHTARVKVDDVCVPCDLFDGWPWKTILYATTSSVHHSLASSEFKLELQSGNARFRWKSVIFRVWPWNLTDDLQTQ